MNQLTKTYIFGAIGLLIVLSLLWLGNRQETSNEVEVIEIGATLPLTGPLAIYGNAIKDGVILAQEEINARGGVNGKQLNTLFQDNKGDAKQAVVDVSYLANQKRVPVIFNTLEFLTLSSKDISQAAQTVMITFTSFRLTSEEEYTYRDYFDFEQIGSDFAKVANNRGVKRVGILAQQQASYAYFKQGLNSLFKGEVVLEENFQLGETDFRTTLLRLKNANIDAIMVYAFPVEANRIIKQMNEQGLGDIQIFLTEGSEEATIEGNEDTLQATQAVTYLASELSPEHQEFIHRYRSKYGKTPRPETFYAYEETKLTAQAIEKCGMDQQCLEDAIGRFFDEDHNKHRSVPIITYNHGWKILDL